MSSHLNRFKVAALAVAVSIFSNHVYADDKQTDRVPTEELVEGIKSRDGRWFEVELIVFERTDDLDFREVFDKPVKALEPARKWDLVRDQLQPDIQLMLNKLNECHTDKNPLNNIDDLASPISEDLFFQQMQDYKTLISSKWQFTNELCLLPSEKLSGIWNYHNNLLPLTKAELSHIPLDSIPDKISAGDYDDFHDVYLLADQNLELKEQFFTLKKHRSFNPILHLGWRQPGLAKRRSIPVYLVAGKNYSADYRYDGSAIVEIQEDTGIDAANDTSNVELMNSPEELLNANVNNSLSTFIQKLQSGAVVDFKSGKLVYPNQSTMPKQTFQLDGVIQVHLNHYLFIDSEFNYRQPKSQYVQPDSFLELDDDRASQETKEIESELTQTTSDPYEIKYLQNYHLKQNLRVYSGDIHYMDHPKFGVLIQIRKYRH